VVIEIQKFTKLLILIIEKNQMFRNRKKRIKEKLLSEFGNLKTDSFDFEYIESFFRKKDHSSAFHTLSDKTCNDLDFSELFMFIDRTNSKVGQQYLYNKLRTFPSDFTDTCKHEKLLEEFKNKPDFRVSVQHQLSKLKESEVYYIASLFQDEILKPPKWYFIVPLLSFASVLSFIMVFFNPVFLFFILGLSVFNIIIHFWNKKNLFNYFSSIPQLSRLNSVAQELFKNESLKQINPDLMKSTNVLNKVSSRMSVFNLEAGLQNDQQIIFWALMEIVKIVFLIEPIFLFGTLKRIDTKRTEIENVFLYVGEIDALVSIASLRKGLKDFCIPKIIGGEKKLNAQEVYHPLIENCIKNNLKVNDKSILLTGSNMSGKTSFIRTIGINVITGLTLNTCFAKEFSMSGVRIYSAIRISDDLMNDKSYYFEEVITIKEMIDKSIGGNLNLFLLDEIFKGTNTVERISAGKAVLSLLNKDNNIVFVSTHDIELADFLKNEYDLYHFSEIIDHKTVDFDFKLKEGKLKNRNAIRILQINNYPDSIIKEAIEISEELDKTTLIKLE
jgi:DNA mismatch repair ATPase MutS